MGCYGALHAVCETDWQASYNEFACGDKCGSRHGDDGLPMVARQGIRRIPERGSQIPKDFPPYSTVQRYFYDWRDSGLWKTIRFNLAMDVRELEGREASPTAGVIDSQTVKTTESGGACGYDAGKKINGRKRHIVTDTIGMMFGLLRPRG
jgi:transposase